ncbi:flagellar brake protein [Spirochaeta cellobiosiphila]|uniref:flagellar brake protein n=1 Tax=Spirochaeta cellobiosiphila TaxID=504483 RepID=UPI0004197858|nr:PilZ domain-containing protein [Spirochaeta cellobiosiphila]
MLILVLVLLLLAALGLVGYKVSEGKSFPWFQFYFKGRESGFSIKEIQLLGKAARETRLDNPISLFWSINKLDRMIRAVIIKAKAKGSNEHPDTEEFIGKLYDFRKQVEFNTPKYRLGLNSTRGISPHQKIRINVHGIGTYHSQVIENLRRYIAISYPQGKKLPMGYSWKGKKLNIYFWRGEDAGYFFETRVIDDFLDRKYPLLYIEHSDSLIRSQKRRSVRVEANGPVAIFNLENIENANENFERGSGLRGRLMDISEDGLAILVGGRAKVGLPLKVQFTLSEFALVMCGVVKGVTFDEKSNRSLLHIQANPPSNHIKNSILSYVYNIFDEREERTKRRV